MKIAIDCRMRHGVETIVKNLAPLVASHVDQLYVLGDPKRFAEWWPNGISATVVKFTAPIYGLREQIEFPLSQIRDCDVLHVPHFNVPVRRLPFPMLVTINDVGHLAGVLPMNWAHKRIAGLYYRHAVARADHIVTLSEFSKSEIVSRLNVPRERITIVPCAVDHTAFHRKGDDQIQRVLHQLDIRTPYLLISGSVRPHKNVGRVLKAFAELKKRHRIPHHLVIVGERAGFRINSALPELPADVHKDVRFTGYIPDDDLVALYSGAEVFVFASVYEGFGLPPLEAMACGAPVAVSRAASMPEVVGDAGLYFDPYSVDDIVNAIYALTSDPERRRVAAAASLRRAATFQWSSSAKMYVEVLKNILSSRL